MSAARETRIDDARTDTTRSSGGGIAFLIAYAITLGVCGLLGLYLSPHQTAMATLIQGGLALPLALGLERSMGFPAMRADNPMKPLVLHMAFAQVVALPAVVIVLGLDPSWVPAAFAAIAGGQLLPYAWVHRTKAYVFLGAAVALVPAAIRLAGGPNAMPYSLLAWSTLYVLGAIVIRSQVAARTALPIGAREVE